MRPAAVVVTVAVAATVLAVVLQLTSSATTLAGTNSTLMANYVAVVAPGERVCQTGERIPAGAGELEVFTGVFGRPGPRLELLADNRPVGRRDGGYVDGWIGIGLTGAARGSAAPLTPRRLCIVNRGTSRVAFGGLGSIPTTAARVHGKPSAGRLALHYRPSDEGSWWSLGSTIADRVTFGKADLGPWTPVVLLVLVWAGALVLVLRTVP